MEIKRIELDGTINTRDLGQFTTSKGKKIKSKMLLRSGNLHNLSDNDLAILKNEYNVKAVIDFRTDTEVDEQTDIIPENAEYYRLTPLTEASMGITHEKKTTLELFVEGIRFDQSADEYMMQMYEKILFSESGIKSYKKFFEILTETDGCVLWHCTAGKDRAGIASVLIEYVLGVDKQIIIEDYLKTAYFMKVDNEKKLKFYLQYPGADTIKDYIIALMDVRPQFIEHIFNLAEKNYGSVDLFIENGLGINRNIQETIRNKYLY